VRRGLTRVGTIVILALVVSLTLGAMPQAGAKTTRREHLLELINAKREAKGVDALRVSPHIATYSRHHSGAMARRGYLFHTANLANQLESVHWSIAGENVGSGGDLDALFDAFMASAPHRKNILRASFDRVGLGIVQRHGDLWVTMVFYG
jgi:uncharacterized protein YkwD